MTKAFEYSMRGKAFGRLATLLLLAVISCAVMACVSFFPSKAYAYFNDVAEKYSATQKISTSGSPLTGADIPEGTYNITAQSSSYMCKLSNVKLTSVGGQLWVTFNISTAYSALYLGSAEEAAKHTNDEGTDYSAYYVSGRIDTREDRKFNLPIPALNQNVTIATYNGGSKGLEEGAWYTRMVVFESSSEVTSAIDAAKNPSSSGSSPKQEEGEAKPSNAAPQPSSSDSADKEGGSKTASNGSPRTGKYYGPAEKTGQQGRSDAGSRNGASLDVADAALDESLSEEEAKSALLAAGKMRAVELSFISEEDLPLAEGVAAADQNASDYENDSPINPLVLAVIVIVVDLVLAGVFLLVIRQAKPRGYPRV